MAERILSASRSSPAPPICEAVKKMKNLRAFTRLANKRSVTKCKMIRTRKTSCRENDESWSDKGEQAEWRKQLTAEAEAEFIVGFEKDWVRIMARRFRHGQTGPAFDADSPTTLRATAPLKARWALVGGTRSVYRFRPRSATPEGALNRRCH
jgi:hypothetical protein